MAEVQAPPTVRTFAMSILCPGVEARYADLLKFENSLRMDEAHRQRRRARQSAIYAHFCRRGAIEPLLLAATGGAVDRETIVGRLNSTATIYGGSEPWIIVYVGLATAFESGRTPADRFNHEFGLTRYLRQAPALEALFLVTRSAFEWTTTCRNPGVQHASSLDIVLASGREEFLNWCAANVRCAWVERHDLPRTRIECGALLRTDETRLIQAWRPLLNVVANQATIRFAHG